MKIIPNYYTENTKVSMSLNNQSFTSSVNESENKPKGRVTLPAVSLDYDVNVPIAYNHIEDIKINDSLTAKCYKLANGQKVVIVPKEGPTVVKTYVNTGSFNEPDNLRGISHYIEHNLFNGSETLGEKVFFDEVNKMGADTNASTSFSVTDYYIQSNLLEENDLENQIKLQAGQLQSPKFLLDKLNKEKSIVNSEINMYMSEDESLGYNQTIKNLFNIKSDSLDLVAGTTNNIDNLTRDDVVNYYKSNYYPANMVTVITGEVDTDETMKLVAKYFTAKNNPVNERKYEKLEPITKTIRQDIISPKNSGGRASIFLGFVGPENNNTKDKIYMRALSVLAGGLANSRTTGLENKYGAYINFSPERLSSRAGDKSLYMVSVDVSNGKSEILLKDLYSTLDKLSKYPPTEDEMTAIKNSLKKAHNRIFESSYALNQTLGQSLLNNNIESVKDFNKIVDEMTAEDILNTAKKYLDLKKAALTVVHPNQAKKDDILNTYDIVSQIPFTGVNKKQPIDINSVKEYKLPNNMQVVLKDGTSDNVNLKFSIEEKHWTPKKAAISDVLALMLDNSGTQDKSIEEYSKSTDLLALDLGVFANPYGLHAIADFPVDTVDKSLALLAEKIQKVDLSEDNFNNAKALLKERFDTIEPSPYFKFDKVIYDGTPMAFTPEEKLQSLNDITIDDIKDFYKEIFEKSQGQVVITAPFSTHPELKQSVFNSFGQYPKVQEKDTSLVNVYKPVDKTQVLTTENKKNQAKIIQGFKFQQNGNLKDRTCIELLNEILGGSPSSRLFGDLREQRHLAYSVSSNCDFNDDMGVLTLSIGTTTENKETGLNTYENIQKSIEGFNENIYKLKTEKVSQEELENAKKVLKTNLLNTIESSYGQTSDLFFSLNTPYGLDYINKQIELIDQITPDDIYNTANHIFKEKPVYSITATKASLDANKEYLDSLTKNG